MAILTSADSDLFPSVSLTGAELSTAIAQCQLLIESAIGRSLEVVEYVEVRRPSVGVCYLRYFPVLASPAPTARCRTARGLDRFYRPVLNGDWSTLTATDFTVYSDGRVEVPRFDTIELEITYSAGFDFSVASSVVTMLKTAAGKVLEHLQTDQYAGVTARRVEGEYSVSYSDMAIAQGASIPSALLAPFQKYRARGWGFS